MITFDEASAILRGAARPLEAVEISLAEAAGHRLAGDVAARIDAPRSDVSAMDGYAVRNGDLHAPLSVVGTSYAGSPPGLSVEEGEAVRIFTGAPVPQGADWVIVQEIVEREGDIMRLTGEFSEARHIRPRGSDFSEGDVLLEQGAMLGPRQMVAAAAAGQASLSVWRKPRVAILATGDELVAPGKSPDIEGSIPDSISLALAALSRNYGAEIAGHEICADDPAKIAQAAGSLLSSCDVLVMVGGASVGERDFASSSIAGGNFETLFAKVAMRPGKPVWCAKDAKGRFVLGLPGNPTSAMVTARLFLAPLLTALAGGEYDDALVWKELELLSSMPAPGPREHFGRGRLVDGKAEPFANQQSGAQAALAAADVLLRQPGGSVEAGKGETIATLDF